MGEKTVDELMPIGFATEEGDLISEVSEWNSPSALIFFWNITPMSRSNQPSYPFLKGDSKKGPQLQDEMPLRHVNFMRTTQRRGSLGHADWLMLLMEFFQMETWKLAKTLGTKLGQSIIRSSWWTEPYTNSHFPLTEFGQNPIDTTKPRGLKRYTCPFKK